MVEKLDHTGGLFCDIQIDETNEKDAKRIREFLDGYKKLCKKHGCLVVADGEDVEVAPLKKDAESDDPWCIEETTRERGWKI